MCGSGVIDTPTVTPTCGFQDRRRSQPLSSSVRQRRHDGFELSSRSSSQIDSGDRLERLEQVVKSIALRLGLLVDDDEANRNRKTNMADLHLRIIVFRMTLSRKGRIHRGIAKLLPLGSRTKTPRT